MNKGRMEATVIKVLTLLAAKDYVQLAEFGGGKRMAASDIRRAMAGYPFEASVPSGSIAEFLDIVEVRGSFPRRWSVCCPVWTKEEGRSDLTVEMTVTETEGELYAIELDGIHVL